MQSFYGIPEKHVPRPWKDPGLSWFPHYVFNLVEFTIRGIRRIFLSLLNVHKFNFFVKQKYIGNKERTAMNYFSSCKNRCYNFYMQLTDKCEFVELRNE